MLLKNSYGYSQFHDVDAKAAFGLGPKDKWPPDGLPGRKIQGVNAWVDPLGGPGFRLRARCLCPACGVNIALGRLNQHAKIHR